MNTNDRLSDFLDQYSHFILLGWFMAVFVVILLCFGEIPLYNLFVATGLSFGSTLVLSWNFYLYQKDVERRRFAQWSKVSQDPSAVPTATASDSKKPADSKSKNSRKCRMIRNPLKYKNVDELTQAEVNRRFENFRRKHKK